MLSEISPFFLHRLWLWLITRKGLWETSSGTRSHNIHFKLKVRSNVWPNTCVVQLDFLQIDLMFKSNLNPRCSVIWISGLWLEKGPWIRDCSNFLSSHEPVHVNISCHNFFRFILILIFCSFFDPLSLASHQSTKGQLTMLLLMSNYNRAE